MNMANFRKEDYWTIRWHFVFLALSLVIVAGIYMGLDYVEGTASAELRSARDGLNAARDTLAKIEQEESTIVEYIGRYQEMEAQGVMRSEDRLQLLEQVAVVRGQEDLFPIQLNIDEQVTVPLLYDPSVAEPGRPISLHVSKVDVTFPLLHEDDLVRLLDALVGKSGLLQPQTCSLSANSAMDGGALIYLAQHFNAACTLQWYTFSIDAPPAGVPQQ